MSSASPQRWQRMLDCGGIFARQLSQTGRRVDRSKGVLQIRQSDGKAVVTRSSRRERNAELARPEIRHSEPLCTWPVSDPARLPGGEPVTTWSVLSFRLSLKMHLTERRTRPARAGPMPAVSHVTPALR